jgi:hypothetical protein
MGGRGVYDTLPSKRKYAWLQQTVRDVFGVRTLYGPIRRSTGETGSLLCLTSIPIS